MARSPANMRVVARRLLPSKRAPSRLVLETHAEGMREDFADDVARGLTRQPKRIPFRYFYDATGSALFEAITRRPEYYLTRVEAEILRARADLLAVMAPPGATLVELGSGSSVKTRLLIDALLAARLRLRYVPIDISRPALESAARALLRRFPRLEVHAIAAEYDAGLDRLPRVAPGPKLALWLGSNIGNLGRSEAAAFLRRVRRALSPRDRLVVGMDLRKERSVLEAAYDDAAGVTAAFNLNLLARINRELGGDFDLDAFRHRAAFNEEAGRVEISLVSARAQRVRIERLAMEVDFAAGEAIETEESYKYSPAEIRDLARAGGFRRVAGFRDARRRFALEVLAPAGAAASATELAADTSPA